MTWFGLPIDFQWKLLVMPLMVSAACVVGFLPSQYRQIAAHSTSTTATPWGPVSFLRRVMVSFSLSTKMVSRKESCFELNRRSPTVSYRIEQVVDCLLRKRENS